MFAKSLEAVLYDLCRASDVHHIRSAELDRRFKSLRGFGRLPRGRENRARPLTDRNIASALMGMVPVEPGWAGHGAALLEKLKPVGSDRDAFAGAADLLAAISVILSDKAVRDRLISLRMSVAESGTNANGSATITYKKDGARSRTFYVHGDAASLLQPGAEARFDDDQRHAPFSREVTFNRRFFDRLTRAIDQQRAHPRPPAGDGSEYDADDAERVRRKRLEVSPSSRFLHVGVDNQVTWPRRETLITFDKYKLVLMPKTKEHVQSVHIDLHANRLSDEEALTVINRFLSLLTWCDDQYAIAEGGWSGSPVPIAVPKRDLAFTTADHWVFNRGIPTSAEQKRALALYREARNAEQNSMISYAVLNYYKIIEIRYPKGPAARDWLAKNIPTVRDDPLDQHGIPEFLAACGRELPERYIYKACRVAVAHASEDHPSDPDDTSELRRLHNAADVLRRLARLFISTELGVSDSPFAEETFTYFAYGSNMLTAWLKARCPSAEAVGNALAQDYQLAFAKRSIDGSGKATLLPAPGSVTHGVLFRIPTSERAELDAAEGKDYRREDSFVVAGSSLPVTAYLAVPAAIDLHLKPYDWYRDLVRAGAKQHGLPRHYQDQLDVVAADVDPDPTRKSRLRAVSFLEAAGMDPPPPCSEQCS